MSLKKVNASSPRLAELIESAAALAVSKTSPPIAEFEEALDKALDPLLSEAEILRPRDRDGLPGGLLVLPDLPVVILPDLHTRADFLASVLSWAPPLAEGRLGRPGSKASAERAPSLLDLLGAGEALLLCLGDAFHSEGQGASARWKRAYQEYASSWQMSRTMDEEMGRALSCVELILQLKAAFPEGFHYLKGNHDNIVNEEGHGDHPFYKYSEEGAMAASWFSLRYGKGLQRLFRDYELSLPLAARGSRFVASHAEPAFALTAGEIIDYRGRPDVVEALTWTPNDGASPGSVAATLEALLGPAAPRALWFGGHRPVPGRFASRQDGRYIQFHNPDRRNLVLLEAGRDPEPERAVLDLGPSSSF